jgi:inner membrane protein
MASNPFSGLIPRGSLGLKLLLVCFLALVMLIPLTLVQGLVNERQSRAITVTEEVGAQSGGRQQVGGPILIVPAVERITGTDDQGRPATRLERRTFLVYAQTGTADANVAIQQPLRRKGIYKAAVYTATTRFTASFDPAAALADVGPDVTFDWSQARIMMFVADSRAIREAVILRFDAGGESALEPLLAGDLSSIGTNAGRDGSSFSASIDPSGMPTASGMQTMAGAVPVLAQGPRAFAITTDIILTGAQRFSLAAFAMETQATIRGDWRSTLAEGFFQTTEPMQLSNEGFVAAWNVPFLARGVPKASAGSIADVSTVASRDMAVSFSAVADVYQGAQRAVRYGLMFVGIVFLAVFIFEAAGGRKAHPAQYVLVGLAQCVFYLLLLSLTELWGFTPAFLAAAGVTVPLLSFYAASSFNSMRLGLRAFVGLTILYGAMYVLMTMEDYALLAGSVVAFVVILGAMLATRKIDWYGASANPN